MASSTKPRLRRGRALITEWPNWCLTNVRFPPIADVDQIVDARRMRLRVACIGMVVLSACTRHVEVSATYPPDVETFIKRDANCNTPRRLDAAGRQQWGCDKLLADRRD